MKPEPLFFVLITFGILGCIFLGLVAGLANIVTNEYVDYSLPGDPIVQEYDFRVGGRYGLVTLSLLLGGSVLAIAGNVIGIHAFYKYKAAKQRSRDEEKIVPKKLVAKLLIICPRCKNKLQIDSKFCPKCGIDFTPKAYTPPQHS